MMSRRRFVAGASTGAGLLLTGCDRYPLPSGGSLLEAADGFTYEMQRLLLPRTSLAREFDRSMVSKVFPAINEVAPADKAYQRDRADGFSGWRLPVTGLIDRPMALSLADLRRFPARTQITQHNCVDGWSAIAEWTGVQLSQVLAHVRMKPQARFVQFHCVDGWWDSYDLTDALHPQTILAYGMNGRPLPMAHGAPVRLRVELQLGYKSLKFLTAMHVTDVIGRHVEYPAKGSSAHASGYNWYAGI